MARPPSAVVTSKYSACPFAPMQLHAKNLCIKLQLALKVGHCMVHQTQLGVGVNQEFPARPVMLFRFHIIIRYLMRVLAYFS